MANQGSSTTGHEDLTLVVLGCGGLGTAILSGILSSLSELPSSNGAGSSDPLTFSGTLTPSQQFPPFNTSTQQSRSRPASRPASPHPPNDDTLPARLPTKFIACVRHQSSSQRIKTALAPWISSVSIPIMVDRNVLACKSGDVILLGCEPWAARSILGEAGMRSALSGKILISICAGLSTSDLESFIYGPEMKLEEDEVKCTVVRTMPNTASRVRESMTVIALPEPAPPESTVALLTWIFRRIGDVVFLPSKHMDASTALCGSGPAFFALMLEGAIQGAVAMGIPARDATRMAAQTMKGVASLVLDGEQPANLREKVCTPGGCTIQGICLLEENAVRGNISGAVRHAARIAGGLGKN